MHSRMIWLDSLRLLAGVSMIGLHASSDANGQPFPDFDVNDRFAPLLLRAVIYTARTELFLIIALFLLLLSFERRPRGYGQTLAEQAKRLLLPFLFWTVFYAFYSLNKARVFGYDEWLWTQLAQPQVWLEYLILGGSKYHMHFLPTLFALVLFYPLYRLAQRQPWLGLAVILGLLIKRELDVYLWANWQGMIGFDYLIRAVKILSYIGYGMIAGAAVGLWQRGQQLTPHLWGLVLLGLGLFTVKLWGTYLTAVTGQWQHNFTPGYWADFLMPALLFLCFMALHARDWPIGISLVSKYAFGIYLCHPIFLDLVEIALLNFRFVPIEMVAIKIGLAFTGTCVLVVMIEKTRLLAWTIGLGPLPTLFPRVQHA